MPARRAVLMRHSDADPGDIEQLVTEHGLEIVQTVIADIESVRMTVLIAVEHVLTYSVDAIVIPHLTVMADHDARLWRLLTELVDIFTMTGVLSWTAEVSR